jgi:hypothetical protein
MVRAATLLPIIWLILVAASTRGDSALPAGKSLAQLLTGKTILVEYDPSPPARSAVMSRGKILCEVLEERLHCKCFNIHGEFAERKVLKSIDLTPIQAADAWLAFIYDGKDSAQYDSLVNSSRADYGVRDMGGTLMPLMWVYWEASYSLKIYDARKPATLIAKANVVGGKWGFSEYSTGIRAYRAAAESFVRKAYKIQIESSPNR